jgi:dienelactone hydrolase
MLDQPGNGEVLRLQDLTARIDTEAWAGGAVDWLPQRDDVEASRIGFVGWSLGGYYRLALLPSTRRFALCVAWRPTTAGGRPASPARARGRAAGATLLGARSRCGATATWTHSSPSPTTCT